MPDEVRPPARPFLRRRACDGGALLAETGDIDRFTFTRNPMYVGLTLGYPGEAGLLVLVWPVLVLVCVNCFVIPVEEASLQVFGGYTAYRARVRRWLSRRSGPRPVHSGASGSRHRSPG